VRANVSYPLPLGFGVVRDASLVELEPGLLSGGRPWRVLRVTPAGRAAFQQLEAGRVRTRPAGVLGRRLLDAGLMHPVPPTEGAVDAITVVIPVYGRVTSLAHCLAGLGRTHAVIVVDDGSSDPSPIRSVAEHAGAQLIRLDHNVGPAAARNAGLRAVTTPLVAFVDSDTLPSADDLSQVARHLLDPATVAAAPRVAPRTGRTWAGRYARVRCPLDLGPHAAGVSPYGAVSYVPSAVLLARRADLLAVNGFDASMRVGEDVDLVWRLLAAGHRIRYAPEVAVGHEEPSSWRELLARRFRYGRSTAALGRRHPTHVAPFILQPAFTATVVAALLARPRTAAVGAISSFLQVRRIVTRAGLPRRRLVAATADGLWQTYLGLGRWLAQLGGPALVVLVARASWRGRLAAATLAAGPLVASWRSTDRSLDLPRFAVGALADDLSYGAGVLTGCWSARTLRPLIPRVTTLESSR
jgi:mycofactocin system glycosyltransferase